MYTNADQLTSSKKDELEKRIQGEKPTIIAVCEVKPKNSKERTEIDYQINDFTINPINLDSDDGRGIIIYTHNSLDKSIVQVIPEKLFEEACVLETRLRWGDLVLFGCFYRSPTPTSKSGVNNDNLNPLLQLLLLEISTSRK